MTMTIDEKYDNAIQMLHGYYDGKNERLRIARSVLNENGFNTAFYGEFVSMICPRLGREGILKESPFPFLPSDEGIIDRERYRQLSRKMDMADLSFAEYGKIQGEISALDRIITFVVDGKKLDTVYKKQSVTDDEKKSETKIQIKLEGKKLIKKDNTISVHLKSGLLRFNQKTGVAKLNDIEATLHPSGQECKLLASLTMGDDHRATFVELLGQDKAISISARRNLTFVLKNLKKALGILPKRKAKNKDIIKSIKGIGYRLII